MDYTKPILFIDFDGTLCHDKFWRSLDPGLKSAIQTKLFGSNKEMVRNWMLGKYTSEQINEMLERELDIEYENLWSTFVHDCQTMTINPDALMKIDELRSRHITVLLTDNMDCFDRFTVPALGLNEHFDLIVNSWNEKQIKDNDNGAAFIKIIERHSSTISESILIDNSVRSCKVFESLGGTSFLVTPEKTLVHWLTKL